MCGRPITKSDGCCLASDVIERLKSDGPIPIREICGLCVLKDNGTTAQRFVEVLAQLAAAQHRATVLEAALKKIADTGLDSEGDGFADADSLIMVARKALHAPTIPAEGKLDRDTLEAIAEINDAVLAGDGHYSAGDAAQVIKSLRQHIAHLEALARLKEKRLTTDA